LLQEVAGSMRPRAIAKRQELRTQFEDGLMLQSDPERLRQVFHNLLDNAIKYTPEEGCVEVRSFSNSDEITVEVRDNGVGIGEEHRSRVFDRFYRINTASEVEQDGVGLGLSIVESNVDLLGGCVELFRLDSQTVFRVSFPNTAR
ncbi:MAG: sensor histidine kinase, partial [Rhodopirellula sp. JB055]|uniref:sensor histidine kinase n=1 Tax=Rhodopirellula sp. JB055 TaxID=3342846 RepID=UPI00370C0121